MDEFVASTPLQARLLLDVGNAPLLALLMAGERSAGGLARELSRDVRWVHYRLGRLCEAGLIQVAREEKRAGRAVKHYAALGQKYRVPFSLTDAATLRELIASLYAPFLNGVLDGMASVLADRDAHTLTLTLDGEGRFQLGFDAPPSGTSLGMWSALGLTPARAAELRARLMALYEEFGASPDEEGARTHLVGLILTPGDLPG